MTLITQPGSLNGLGIGAGASVLGLDYGNGNVSPGTMWTPGSTFIRSISSILPQTAPIKQSLLGISITAWHQWGSEPAGGATFGKWGKVLAGLLLNQPGSVSLFPSPSSSGGDFGGGIQNLPSDQSNIITLWDAAVDSMPPQGVPNVLNPAPPVQYLSGATVLSTPFQFQEGQSLALGVWILPSLLGGYVGTSGVWQVMRAISNVNYSLQYDVEG